MSFIYAFVCTVVMFVWSYMYLKTYQLCGYVIPKFFNKCIEFKLAFGDKNNLVFTKRMIRFVVLFILISYLLFWVVNYFVFNSFLKIVDCTVILLCTPILIIIIHSMLLPLELLIKACYKKRAVKKIRKKTCVSIGITGSYGKTSTKNILAHILEKEFKVCMTPENYNTEMGITKAILSKLDDEDIFIAEMGARHQGDIKVLAKMIEPDFAIITTIGNQHLETFKTIETIEKTKFELVENMKSDGIAIFNGDSKSTKNLYNKCTNKKYLCCVPDSFAYAKNNVTDEKGSSFTLIIDNREINVTTRLLGKCNINNIVTASALASIMGVSDHDIKNAIRTLEAVPHRLELINAGEMTILDDSYNSNIVGASEALKVLGSFKGRKIVITPGFVELGDDSSQANFKLGAQIADVADYLIIMNKTNKNYILSGAISHNFDNNKIYFASSREEQKDILMKLTCSSCVVLFENDLPDDYI